MEKKDKKDFIKSAKDFLKEKNKKTPEKKIPKKNEIILSVSNLFKSFGEKEVTRGVNLDVKKGEFVAIIGGSGEGKSVLFKQIIGLIKPDKGEVIVDGIDVTKVKDNQKEEVFKTCGYVFQFAALLDSLTVLENVGINLFEKGEKKEDVEKIVISKLNDVGLSQDVLDKFPSELSGGMKKRVGLARTLVREPKVLLYDEPTTGLDPITVSVIHKLMKDTHDKTGATTLAISHDVDIFNYADQVAMLYEGKIIFKGPAKTIWQSKDPFIHQFIRGEVEGPIQKENTDKPN